MLVARGPVRSSGHCVCNLNVSNRIPVARDQMLNPEAGGVQPWCWAAGSPQMSSQQNAKAFSHLPCPPARGCQPESEPPSCVTGALKSHSGDTHGSCPCAAKGGTERVTGEKHYLVDTQCRCAKVTCGPVSLHGGRTPPNMGGAEGGGCPVRGGCGVCMSGGGA